MKTIVCGNNYFSNFNEVKTALETCGFSISEIVSSSQGFVHPDSKEIRGVEKLAEHWAKQRGVSVKVFDLALEKIGLDSTHLRIERMMKYADALVAVWDMQCLGVYDMIEQATKCGLTVFVHVQHQK
ncbi:MAG: hypothetical protein KDD40_00840 [Bdellovibrionales bacterium]|nr:hypothetical protein [Bdellovibrionales bacterium]